MAFDAQHQNATDWIVMTMRRRLTYLAVVLLIMVIVFAILLPRMRGSEASRPDPAASGPWFDIAFTTPAEIDRPGTHQGGIDTRLVTLIDGAQRTVDIAVYDFDLMNVAEAMARASGRGVRVRMVTDSDTVANVKDEHIQAALKTVRSAKVTIVEDNRRAIMHHKFAVVDEATVLTGSWNFTDGDTYRLNNNAVIVRNGQLAVNFTHEFEDMFVQKRFWPTKSKVVPNPRITIGKSTIETYFASETDPSQPLTRRIEASASRIDFLAFAFTHDGLAAALISRKRAGIPVRRVFEKTGSETRFSEYAHLRDAGAEVYQDGNRYVMHHKAFVIDGTTTAFGSFNFSDNATTDNDESLLIVDDPVVANAFTAEVDRVVAVARKVSGR